MNLKTRKKDKGIVYIDRTFIVKGVGVVITGFSFTSVKVHDKLKVVPGGKEVEIKSIRVLDEDQESVEPGVRIGFALRNVKENEMKDALLLVVKDNVKTTRVIKGKIFSFPWTKINDNQNYHVVSAGVAIMGQLKMINSSEAEIFLNTEIPLTERYLIIDVNAKQGKPRIVGYLIPE